MSTTFRKRHESLDVWILAMDLVCQIYRLTSRYPADERFGLVQQMRRAACSIPSNIAEGAARETGKENLRALFYARGSLAELETQLEISRRLEYPCNDIDKIVDRISQSLSGYIRYVKRNL
jgi:four helix bundle protein